MLANLDKTYKELAKIFGVDAVEKVRSHIFSVEGALEDMRKSRNNWKIKYHKLKEKCK